MPKGRAERRHHTARKKARTRKILKRYTHGSTTWLDDRRVGRFTASHWGCQCEMCMNPRRLMKGKKVGELTRAELLAFDDVEE